MPFCAVLGVALLAGCQKKDNNAVTAENLVVAGNPNTVRSIGDENHQFQILGRGALQEKIKANQILALSSPKAQALVGGMDARMADVESPAEAEAPADSSLVLGFPVSLLGESQVFGAVIIKVSDKKQEKMGQLKLTDLTPIHSRAVVGKNEEGKYMFGIVGCFQNCSEGSDEPVLLAMPALGVDAEKGTVLIDVAELGKELNLIEMLDPQGSFTQLKTVTNKTIAFDYSLSTLVFDVETKMVPLDTEEGEEAEQTTFVTRWYLKLSSMFDPAFKAREAVPGVGFFMTERSSSPKIQRWGRPPVEGGVRYFIKNVPKEYQPVFAEAFDGWNERFKAAIGKKLITYEFLEKDDPRYNLVQAGDVRFNVLEWDLDNIAPYGGFGPSIANQFTGELFTANTLVQGPKIIEGYKKWFDTGMEAETLRAAGQFAKADKLMRDLAVSFEKAEQKAKSVKYTLKLGKHLVFNVKSQEPQWDDPAFQRPDFDALPSGFTFESYMHGYFIDMVEHELGHNMGLRHNFRGNLGAKETPEKGGVSHSVMEYLGRNHRHLDSIGEYDAMAIRYGYAGILPPRADMFCTDEDVAAPNKPNNSAECSRDDAEKDPFKFFEVRLNRGIKLLTLPESGEAPQWSVEDMDREVTAAVTGLGLYALSATSTSDGWTNFFTGGDRPTSSSDVKPYVLVQLKKQLCSTGLKTIIEQKASPEAKAKTEANLKSLNKRVKELLDPMKLYSEGDLACGE